MFNLFLFNVVLLKLSLVISYSGLNHLMIIKDLTGSNYVIFINRYFFSLLYLLYIYFFNYSLGYTALMVFSGFISIFVRGRTLSKPIIYLNFRYISFFTETKFHYSSLF
ncbi:hypothetical protein H312_01349 [Anncaliia algerae PRA339]|uniref:Uncharacterized protein n=1 Tax=Anncaliia algerae PRA339 TaxID=1288291 RepID=A0A059F1P1_9MICR|nr:hypothetical protein H312_01349 [Anncaliia algerae PRA339]